MSEAKINQMKEQIMIGKIRRLLDAGFPVWEIAKFLGQSKETIFGYKKIIEEADKNRKKGD